MNLGEKLSLNVTVMPENALNKEEMLLKMFGEMVPYIMEQSMDQ